MKIEKKSISELSAYSSDYDFFNKENKITPDLYSLPLVSGKNLIWGHDIVVSASENNIDDIYCRIIEGNTENNLISLLLLENRIDEYSWNEKEKILNFMKKNNIDNNTVIPLIQTEGSFIPNTEKYANLSLFLKTVIDNNITDLKTALRLEIFNDDIIQKIINITNDFSFSRKRLFISYIVELYKKGENRTEDILFILDNAASADNSYDYIEALRYPSLKKLEKDFSLYTENHLKGSGIQLKSPQNFEGGSYSVQFSFKTSKQLGRIIDRLKNVRDTSDEIFRLL